MTAILRAALLATLTAACVPRVTVGQDTSTVRLLRRIEVLERANADLERRVRELEAVIKSKPSAGRPIQVSNKWKDLANWRQLKLGMSMDKVRELLGEPERVEASVYVHWRWGKAEVYFSDGKLDGWSEPER